MRHLHRARNDVSIQGEALWNKCKILKVAKQNSKYKSEDGNIKETSPLESYKTITISSKSRLLMAFKLENN